jgi:hypothetical protein
MTDDVRYRTPAQHAERLSESLHLALEIADEAARSDIESLCPSHSDGGHLWWFARSPLGEHADPYHVRTIERAVTYLDGRDLLVRHATVPALVRFKS